MVDKELIYKDDARAAVLKAEPRAAYCIDRVKTVDAVEVVRCKDCKQYTPVEGGKPLCALHSIAVAHDDFCSYGERRREDG